MDFRGRRRRRSGMSFYMALGLCVAAVCLAVLSTVISRQTNSGENVLTEWTADQTPEQSAEGIYTEAFGPDAVGEEEFSSVSDEDEPEDTTPYRRPPEEEERTQPAAEDEREEQVKAVSAGIEGEDQAVAASAMLTMPVQGRIIKPFSGTELVFCSTLGDWRVHEGMDIAADAGGEVRCAASGEVMDFFEDPLYGYSVAVSQDDDAVMYYCGLSSTCMVSPGMKVSAGDVIGYVGEVPCEAADGSHIHIALMKDGQFTDPGKYMP